MWEFRFKSQLVEWVRWRLQVKALKSGILINLLDNYSTIWAISREGENFTTKKTSEDKDKENELKAEISSWKKVEITHN